MVLSDFLIIWRIVLLGFRFTITSLIKNKVDPANLTVAIIVEDTPSHCRFSDAEMVSAWESLRLWIDGNPQPSVSDIQDMCEDIETNNIAPGPCRYEPDFVIQNLDTRIRPRD